MPYFFCKKNKQDEAISLIPLIGWLPTNGLLSVVFVRYGQLLAALCTAGSQDAAAILGGHALAETMLVYAATIVRLKCSFHSDPLPLT
jgi:hypothetical protein